MNKKSNRFSPENRERAVRLVREHRGKYPSLWACIKSLEREVKELRRANDILKTAIAFFPRRSWTPDSRVEGVHRPIPQYLRGRADLQDFADCPAVLLASRGPNARAGIAL